MLVSSCDVEALYEMWNTFPREAAARQPSFSDVLDGCFACSFLEVTGLTIFLVWSIFEDFLYNM